MKGLGQDESCMEEGTPEEVPQAGDLRCSWGGRLRLTGPAGVANQASLGENAAPAPALSPLPHLATPLASLRGGAGSAANIAAQAALHLSSVVSDAMRTFGSRYAGAWVDWSGRTPLTRIMVTGSPNASTERLFQGRIAPSVATETELSYAKYSEAQLNAYKKAIVDYVGSHFISPAYRPSGNMIFYIDVQDNSVGIALTHQDVRFLAQLQKLIPADALRVQWISTTPKPAPYSNAAIQPAGGPGWVPGAMRDNASIYKAGLGIGFHLTNDQCTSGFTLRGPFYNQYKYYGITAGHCAQPMAKIEPWVLQNYFPSVLGIGTRVYSYGTGGDYYAYVLTSTYQSSYKA